MAKHRKRSRRKFGALNLLSFGALPKLPESVPTKKLAMGLALGLAGAVGARYAWNHVGALASQKAKALAVNADGSPANPVQRFVNDNLPALGAVLAGVVAYFAMKKKNPSAATALALGSVAAGVAIGGLGVLQSVKAFQGLQVVRLGNRRYGALLTADGGRPGFGAMIAGGSAGGTVVPGYNAPAGSGRLGAMMIAQANPRMQGLLAQHAALNARRV